MANGFNPLADFQARQAGAQRARINEQAIARESAAAPVRNQLAQIGLENARTKQAQQQTGFDQQQALQKATILNQSARALLNIDPTQRQAAFSSLAPRLQEFGIDPNQFAGSQFTDDELGQAIASTQGFLADPQSLSKLELQQRTLDIREKELAQRGELKRLEPTLAGEKERKKLEGQKGIKGEVEQEVAAGKARGKETEIRLQEAITKGLAAADSTATIRRGMQLLDSIETGGVDRAKLGAKQFFGVESAEEGELSNLLGKAVLGQLRETFGAAFTAKEGDSLRAIDANIGKSPSANKRLLQNALKIAERAANRGIDRAVEAKDFKTAAEIQEALDFVLEEVEQPTKQGGQIMIDAQGNRARVFPDGTFEEL